MIKLQRCRALCTIMGTKVWLGCERMALLNLKWTISVVG